MSVVKTAFRGGIWYSAFTVISQTISWGSTLLVARLLSPGDYGLMAMATILVGYVRIFYELGIGSAIVQHEKVTENELSSVFWTLVIWGLVLSSLCFVLAYPTVILFDEPRLYHIAQAVSVLLLLGILFVVPNAILKRHFRFKALGFVMSTSVIVSCTAMIFMAYWGAGVWTLIGGNIVLSLAQVFLGFLIAQWRPKFHFSKSEAISYLRFGLSVVVGNSLYYLYTRSAILFGGRAFSSQDLGYYSLAYQLAGVPNDKIVSLINNVSYPVFSRLQGNILEFRRFYLQLSQFISFIVMPLYCGGLFLAEDLIPWLLGEKWQAAVFPFQILCVSLLLITINGPNRLTNLAMGRPHWNLRFHFVSTITMTIGFYLAALSGNPNMLAIPWLAVFGPSQIVFSLITLRKLEIPLRELIKYLQFPFIATFSMMSVLFVFKFGYLNLLSISSTSRAAYILAIIGLGSMWYTCYILVFHRDFVKRLIRLFGRN